MFAIRDLAVGRVRIAGGKIREDGVMPIEAVDPFDPAILARPHAYWAGLREESAVKRVPMPGTRRAVFFVSRRDDIKKVALDPDTYSSEVPSDIWRWGDLGPSLQPELLSRGWGIVHTIASADPPMHGLYRKIVNGMFLPARVTPLVPRLQASIDTLIETVIEDRPFDFMDGFAIPLPIMMIADMLGLPPEDRPLIRRYTDNFVRLVDPTTPAEAARDAIALFAEGQHYLAGHIARLQRTPDDGLFSIVANARDAEGALLSIEEQLSLCYLLMAAGNETTRNGLALAAYYLASQPALWAALKADPAKVPTFVEEALRLGTPAVLNPRIVTRETRLGDEMIPAGSLVFLLWGSANRDAASFDHADEIWLDRKNPRNHQAFGYGIHSCVGAPLARQELVLSVRALVERFDSVSLAIPQDDVVFLPLFGFRSFAALPLIFSRGRRAG